MYKTSLLSCTATAAIILFNIQFNAHAESLEVSEGKTVSELGKTYETIHVKTGGKITGKDLTMIGNKDINSSENKTAYAVTAENPDSVITLQGNTTIKGTDFVISLGVEAKDSATFQMDGGTITVSDTGALFWNNNNKESKLKDVTISSGKDDTPLNFGVMANKNGTVTLENIKITQAKVAVIANDHSTITVSGGSFDTKEVAISAQNSSTITLTNVEQITSSDDAGLYAEDLDSTITMTGGNVTGKFSSLSAVNGGHIKVTDVALKTTDVDGIGAFSEGTKSVIKLLGNTTINDSIIGLQAQDNGAIGMTGGTIKASVVGAVFSNSRSDENKLEDVTISSSKEGALLHYGIDADKESTVALKDVTVTQAINAIFADNHSTVTVSGGSFDTKGVTIFAQNGSTVILTDSAEIISSENTGLYAKDNGAISMTGGTIKVSYNGVSFANSKSKENKLEGIKISSVKNDALLNFGIKADKGSTVALKDVTVTQANSAIVANDHSTVTVSGGSFNTKGTTIGATNGSTITLTNGAQITSSDGYGIHADGLESTITMTKGSVVGLKKALSADNGGHINVTNVSLSVVTGDGSSAYASGPNSVIELHGTKINHAFSGLYAENSAIIKMTGGTITTSTGGATFYNSKSNENKLEDVTISSNQKGKTVVFTGLNSQASNVTLKNVHITNAKFGAYAMKHSKVTISGGSFSGNDIGVNAESSSSVTLTDNAQITSSGGYGLHADGLESTITMTTGSITGKEAALAVKNGGHIDATNISATAEKNGIKFENPEENTTSEINLTNATLHIKSGIGINVDESTGSINLGKKSKIRGDVLLVNKDSIKGNNFTFTLNSDDSILEGRAKIINSPKTVFNLQNNTQWIVKTSTKEKDEDGQLIDIAQRSRSDVSTLNLNNSAIVFNGPTEEHYHTLHIGSGKPDMQEVYKASGDAKIYFNIAWSDGVASADQKTDRLLIHGDVSGNTTVYIKSDSGDKNSVVNAADPSNIGGLSLIQISGKAKVDSFKLANGYTTLGGAPYKYTLTGYGPESSHGQAKVEQSLFDEKDKKFWDFRLHKEILETSSGSNVIALVPQTANYLVMPTALFSTGLTDMAKQNALLANIRTSILGKEEEKQTGFFLYTYGSTGTLSSERGPLKYGYGADIRYAALQAGVTLAALEGQNTTTHFGLVGTYGQLSFTPKDMADAGKGTLDKWSLTAYGSIQHNSGFYVDTLLSYGILKGNITNALIGKTAKLNDAKMLSISTTVGKEFATNVEGLTFEPQAQLAYQHLMFNTIEDADNFTVDMNNPSQGLIRVGGHLTKTVSAENSRPMSFYGKVNLIKTFGDGEAIHIDENYSLDPMGLAIEGGIGINAQLSHNFSLHGDVSYQQKLQKTGITGAGFSGGIRYQF
ncbi:autotransporter outer membrane beta-barrel domain-containing protein [Bartonella heixiaziensis]|uniref:autotransporter outer membrane beta-barrel domain-containing protein n=1 Tax=Bartonella heixiaziensis TaxID=1461000 RepID=UPI003D23CC9F